MIDPGGADLETRRQRRCPPGIAAPDRAAEAITRVVGAAKGVFLVREFQHRNDRPELFLSYQSAVIVDVSHDGRRKEIARAGGHFPASEHACPAAFGVLENSDDSIVLFAVLNRAELGLGIETAPDLRAPGGVGERIAERV